MSQTMLKYLLASLTGIIAFLEPTINFFYALFFATLLDCLSAYKLSKRVKRLYPNTTKAKFNSLKAKRMAATLLEYYSVVIFVYFIETQVLKFEGIKLTNYVTALFCGIQFWSILENESSCSDKTWAKILQKFLVDKTSRHYDIDLEALKNKAEEEMKQHDKQEYGDKRE